MYWLHNEYEKEFAAIGQDVCYPRNRLVDRDYVYFLKSGHCALSYFSEKGEESLYLYFKENSLICMAPHIAKDLNARCSLYAGSFKKEFHQITTRSDCEMIKMRPSRFLALLNEKPFIYEMVIATVIQNFSNLLHLSTRIGSKSVPVAVCEAIADFMVPHGKKFILPKTITCKELGHLLSAHSMTVVKIVKALESEGVISREGR